MHIEQLTTFREIVRLGSFSEVAKELGVSQPAVTFQIQRLEQELGTKLIDRSQRALSLTVGGKRLLQFAEMVGTEREKLRHDLEQLRENISGDLVIGASTIPGEYILPGLLSTFKERNPSVRIQVNIYDSQAVIDGIRNNEWDIGFCGMAPDRRDLSTIKIARDEIVLIIPSGHPLAGKGQIAIDELSDVPFIAREAASGTQHTLDAALTSLGLDVRKLKPHMILGSTQAVISAVAAGAGVAFVSNLALTGDHPNFRIVPVKGLQLNRDFYCVYRKERIVSRLLEAFIAYISVEASHGTKWSA